MAEGSTSVQVIERMSGSLNRMTVALFNTTSAFYDVNRASQAAFSTSCVQVMTQEVYSYEQQIQKTAVSLENSNNKLNQMEEKTAKTSKQANILQKAYSGIKDIFDKFNVQKILNISDELAQSTSQLNSMSQKFNEINGGAFETSELVQRVYASAQNARSSFMGMSEMVTKFGNNAGNAFSSQQEMVDFTNLLQKQMTLAGMSTTDAAGAMEQLSQELGTGTLSGDKLNNIFKQAPSLIGNIADYLGVPTTEIQNMSSESVLTADMIKNAIFSASDEINQKFGEMPMTWEQIWQSMQNTALMVFQPVLQRVNEIANSGGIQQMVDGLVTGMAVVAGVVLGIFDILGAVGAFMVENWSIISPIIYGVIAALAVYGAYLAITKGIELAGTAAKGVMAVVEGIHAAALMITTGATWSATTAQLGLNGAMYACPIVWIIILIIALVAAIVALCSWIAKNTDMANSWFGVLTGGINVVIQFFKNLGLSIANIALGIWNALGACAENIGIAFQNSIKNIQALFYGLLSVALLVVAGICEALNKLPFIEFDYSGITAKADEYAAKSMEAIESKEDYVSIGDAFNEGMSTFDTFQDGWVSNAFSEGAAWGDGISDKLSSKLEELTAPFDTSSFVPEALDPAYTTDESGSVADNLSNIAGDTSNISDTVSISDENLKYLRDVAERDTINRFTTAEIKVDMQNYNTISSNMDIDGVVEYMTQGISEATEQAAEGVHE